MGQVVDAIILIGSLLILLWILSGILLAKAVDAVFIASKEIVEPVWMSCKLKINGEDHYLMGGRYMPLDCIASAHHARRLYQ